MPTLGYRCAANERLADYFATVVTINLSDRGVANKSRIARISIPHEGLPKLPRLGLCGCTALGVEILSQRRLDEGGNKLHWRVFLCVAHLRGA